jgi:hypothetical protein
MSKGAGSKGQLLDLYTWAKVADDTVAFRKFLMDSRDSINRKLGKIENEGIYTGGHSGELMDAFKTYVKTLTEISDQLDIIRKMLHNAGEDLIKTTQANAATEEVKVEAAKMEKNLALLED